MIDQHMPSPAESFVNRHIGPRPSDIEKMLAIVGAASLDELVDQTVPASILNTDLGLPEAMSESAVVERLRDLASKTQDVVSPEDAVSIVTG